MQTAANIGYHCVFNPICQDHQERRHVVTLPLYIRSSLTLAEDLSPSGDQSFQFIVTESKLSQWLSVDTPQNFQMLESGLDSVVCFTTKCNAEWWLHHVNVDSLDLKHTVCLQLQQQVEVVAYGTILTVRSSAKACMYIPMPFFNSQWISSCLSACW